MKLVMTVGADFIGSAVVLLAFGSSHELVNLDALACRGCLHNLASPERSSPHQFERADLCGQATPNRIFAAQRSDAVKHLAADSHVSRTINGPRDFNLTDNNGADQILDAAHACWVRQGRSAGFRLGVQV